MTTQEYLNILVMLVAALGAWWNNTIWSNQKDLFAETKRLDGKLQILELELREHYARRADVDKVVSKLGRIDEIELLFTRSYMTKDDFSKSMETLFKKLDKIEDKLDTKADKL